MKRYLLILGLAAMLALTMPALSYAADQAAEDDAAEHAVADIADGDVGVREVHVQAIDLGEPSRASVVGSNVWATTDPAGVT